VRDQINLVLRHVVNLPQEFDGPATHHHQAIRELRPIEHDLPLMRVGFPQNGVHSGHHRHAQLA